MNKGYKRTKNGVCKWQKEKSNSELRRKVRPNLVIESLEWGVSMY